MRKKTSKNARLRAIIIMYSTSKRFCVCYKISVFAVFLLLFFGALSSLRLSLGFCVRFLAYCSPLTVASTLPARHFLPADKNHLCAKIPARCGLWLLPPATQCHTVSPARDILPGQLPLIMPHSATQCHTVPPTRRFLFFTCPPAQHTRPPHFVHCNLQCSTAHPPL